MAYEFYVTVEGTKQGRLQGESIRAAATWDRLSGISFHYAVASPRDVASGAGVGQAAAPAGQLRQGVGSRPRRSCSRPRSPTRRSRRCSSSSSGPTSDGEEFVFHTVRLTNAVITTIEQYIDGEPGAAPRPRALERISLTFQNIEIQNLDGQDARPSTTAASRSDPAALECVG